MDERDLAGVREWEELDLPFQRAAAPRTKDNHRRLEAVDLWVLSVSNVVRWRQTVLY